MKLITEKDKTKLLKNYDLLQKDDSYNPFPVIKLFNSYGESTWLISEMDSQNNSILYGLADLGMGFVEYGSIDLKELQDLYVLLNYNDGIVDTYFNTNKIGVPAIEKDLYFKPTKGIFDYLKDFNNLSNPSITV